jgi:iron complex transport system ATP-binding protein
MTILVALHDLNLAAGFFDHLVVLKDGRVFADGPPADVLTPELLRSVYRVEASVITNPATGRPLIAYSHPIDADAAQ